MMTNDGDDRVCENETFINIVMTDDESKRLDDASSFVSIRGGPSRFKRLNALKDQRRSWNYVGFQKFEKKNRNKEEK